MLRHAAVSSQDFLHASSLDTSFDDLNRNFSPERTSHAVFVDLVPHVNFPPAGAMSGGDEILGDNNRVMK